MVEETKFNFRFSTGRIGEHYRGDEVKLVVDQDFARAEQIYCSSAKTSTGKFGDVLVDELAIQRKKKESSLTMPVGVSEAILNSD